MSDKEKKQWKVPSNVAAERCVLAGLCQFGAEASIDIADIVSTECFSNTDNQIVYKILDKILQDSTKADISSIISTATSLGFSEFDNKTNLEYLRSLFTFPINLENVKKNSAIIKKLDIIRKGQQLAKKLYAELSDMTGAEPIGEILSAIEAPVIDFSMNCTDNETAKTELIGKGIHDFIKHLKENKNSITGIPSFMPRYNAAIGGGRRRGGVYIIGARPKAGKSTNAINDAIHVSKNLGIPVLYLDTEMTKEGQLPRILAMISNTEIKKIESGSFGENDFLDTKVTEAGNEIEHIPFSYRKISGMPFDEVLSIIRKWVVQDVGQMEGRTKEALIIYDYFKLMDASSLDNMQEYQALGFQISAMADFCGKYDIPCSAYVQLNRDGVTKETSDTISQSDRLLWLCSSFAILKRKSQEEITVDGPENGNGKLIPTCEQRFGPGLQEGDYINLHVDWAKCRVKEGLTCFEVKRQGNSNTGFNVVESEKTTLGENDEPEFDGPDEPTYDFGDDKYRKD